MAYPQRYTWPNHKDILWPNNKDILWNNHKDILWPISINSYVLTWQPTGLHQAHPVSSLDFRPRPGVNVTNSFVFTKVYIISDPQAQYLT